MAATSIITISSSMISFYAFFAQNAKHDRIMGTFCLPICISHLHKWTDFKIL